MISNITMGLPICIIGVGILIFGYYYHSEVIRQDLSKYENRTGLSFILHFIVLLVYESWLFFLIGIIVISLGIAFLFGFRF